MTGNRHVLSPGDASDLEERGLLGEAQAGMRKLHRRRTYASSDGEYCELPLDVTISAGHQNSRVYVDIPETLISKATLEYVGFTEEKASDLWHRWTHWPAAGPRREVDEDDGRLAVSFKDFIIMQIGASGPFPRNTWSMGVAEWTQCLHQYGLNNSTTVAIMNPVFEHIRDTNTCEFWAKDTIEMRYEGVIEIQRASRERAARLAQGSRSTQQQQLPAHSALAVSSHRHISTTGIIPAAASQHAHMDSTRAAVERAAQNAPGHTFLYRGMDKARINGLFDSSGAVAHFEVLVSRAPSDFSGNRLKYYFTPHFKVAETYAAYAKNRSNCEAVVIVAMMVPNSAIESLAAPAIERLFWPNPDWASLVWHSRRNATLPKHLRKYRESLLIIGHTARHPDSVYAAKQSPAEFSEQDILRVEGRSGQTAAVQYVFLDGDEVREWLQENGAQTTKVFFFSSQDLEDFTREATARNNEH